MKYIILDLEIFSYFGSKIGQCSVLIKSQNESSGFFGLKNTFKIKKGLI